MSLFSFPSSIANHTFFSLLFYFFLFFIQISFLFPFYFLFLINLLSFFFYFLFYPYVYPFLFYVSFFRISLSSFIALIFLRTSLLSHSYPSSHLVRHQLADSPGLQIKPAPSRNNYPRQIYMLRQARDVHWRAILRFLHPSKFSDRRRASQPRPK